MHRNHLASIIVILAIVFVGIESGAAQPFVGPANGGRLSGQVSGSKFIYSGQAFPILDGRVSFPDCTTYKVGPSGRLSGRTATPNCKPVQAIPPVTQTPGAGPGTATRQGRGQAQQRVMADGRVVTFLVADGSGEITMIDDGRGKAAVQAGSPNRVPDGQRSSDPYQLDPKIAQSDATARKLPAPTAAPAGTPRGQQSADPFQLNPPAAQTTPPAAKKKQPPCDPKTPGCVKSPADKGDRKDSNHPERAGV